MSEPLKFEIIDKLGHGQFSNVYKAKWLNAHVTAGSPEAYLNSATFMQSPVSSNFVQNDNQQYQNYNQNNDLTRKVETNPMPISHESCNQTNYSKTASNLEYNEKLVALKKIKFYDIHNSEARMDYLKEVNLLQKVKHPNIINYNISFIARNELYIVLELADGGDLSKLIRYFQKKKRLIPEQTILKYFTQVCSAVEYIHSKRILHRDIKPANIFMTSEGCVKLGDFGLGMFFSQNTRDAHSIVGTFYYMSPERIMEFGYGFSSDVWSLGCVLYELITLSSPFSILNHEQNCVNNLADCHGINDARKRPLMQHQQPIVNANQQHPHQNCQQQNNAYNLQWLFDRIIRAEYPSLDSYEHISLRLRHLANECLNPNSDGRPNMQYICMVVGEAYRLQQQQQSLVSSSIDTTVTNERCKIFNGKY